MRLWSDTRIELAGPVAAYSAHVSIEVEGDCSNESRVRVFQYQPFPVPFSGEGNPLPLALAVDDVGRVWMMEEFHINSFRMLDPIRGRVENLFYPRHPDPGGFASTILGQDFETHLSALGESVLVDPRGRVWSAQGGGHFYNGKYANRSRIVCCLPDALPAERYRIYDVPGTNNRVMGLAWDPFRERIWFAASGAIGPGGSNVVRFDPEGIPYDDEFDCSRLLLDQVCRAGEPESECYRVYPVRSGSGPAHLAVDASGYVWVTCYWGRAISRLDPQDGQVIEYPLPEPINRSWQARLVGPGPWELRFDEEGDLLFNEFYDCTISLFDVDRATDPACCALDRDGSNPCLTDWVMPGRNLDAHRIHSIEYANDGCLWFTEFSPEESGVNPGLGFMTEDRSEMVRLPPLDRFGERTAAGAMGIGVDRKTGDIWIAEFWRKRITRLWELRARSSLRTPAVVCVED